MFHLHSKNKLLLLYHNNHTYSAYSSILRVIPHAPISEQRISLPFALRLKFQTTEYTENSEMGKVKLRFVLFFGNTTHADLTQVKNVPHMILIAIVYHRILQNAVVTSPLDTVCKLWTRLGGKMRLQFGTYWESRSNLLSQYWWFRTGDDLLIR